MISNLKRRILGTVRHQHRNLLRQRAANKYLAGKGIEIGALHTPLTTPRKADVAYLDFWDNDELRKQYPGLQNEKLVDVAIIDNCETLETVADKSQSFLIANHVIEHTQSPIDTLAAWLRVLKPGGILFMAVPDKRWTYDRNRPITPIEHLVADTADGGEASRTAHYQEWVELCTDRDYVKGTAEELQSQGYSIHFHVWDKPAFTGFLNYCRDTHGLKFDIVADSLCKNEMLFVLRKH